MRTDAPLSTAPLHRTGCRFQHALSVLFTVQAAFKKKFEKGQFERRARMEADRLESLLFQLFEREVQSLLCARMSFRHDHLHAPLAGVTA